MMTDIPTFSSIHNIAPGDAGGWLVTAHTEPKMLIYPDRWHSLAQRYQPDRPRRMLALHGGGIRGLLTLGILEHFEKVIAAKTGQRLCEYFDYIAGTRTGAIIAAGWPAV
jgi:Patatin-like phospholipase